MENVKKSSPSPLLGIPGRKLNKVNQQKMFSGSIRSEHRRKPEKNDGRHVC